MKQLVISATLLLLAAGSAVAQRTEFHNNVVNNDFFSVKEMAAKPGKTEGTIYLSKTWVPGTIYLKSGHTLKGYQLNYDLENDIIEIDAKDGIKILPGHTAARFTFWNGFNKDSLMYVNCDSYTYKNIRHNGFYEVVHQGPKMQLLSRTHLEKKKANYNALMDTGSRNDEIIKKENLYVATGNTVREFKDSDDFEVFGQVQPKVTEYAKTYKLKPKRKDDAAKLVAYYNSVKE